MHAVIRGRVAFQVGKFASDARILDPDAGMLHRNIVLHTAGHQTGAAINAAGGVNQKAIFVVGHVLFSCVERFGQCNSRRSLNFLYRYKGLAERLAAADRVGIGDVQVGVAGAHAIGGGQPFGEVPVAGRQVDTIRPDGLGDLQLDMDLPDLRWSLPPSRCP